MDLSINQALEQGFAAHKEGKLQEAEKLYRAILNVQSKHPDANHNLGVLAVGVGKIDVAIPHFKVALEANPKQGQYWLSYIDALIKTGRLDAARQVLDQGRKSGLRGKKIEDLEARLESTESPVSLTTDNLQSEKNQIGGLIALYKEGKLQEALLQGNRLVQQFPGNAMILNIVGAIYFGLSKYEDAIASYKKAAELRYDFAEAHYNLGNVLKRLGRYQEAVASYNKAIA